MDSVGINNNVLSARVQYGSTFGSTVINDGVWHHVAVTWEPGTDAMLSNAILYVDGVPETIGSLSDVAINTVAGGNVHIGKFQGVKLFPGPDR